MKTSKCIGDLVEFDCMHVISRDFELKAFFAGLLGKSLVTDGNMFEHLLGTKAQYHFVMRLF